jgi:hypothetical protein
MSSCCYVTFLCSYRLLGAFAKLWKLWICNFYPVSGMQVHLSVPINCVKVKEPRNWPKAQRGIALLFLDLGARRGWVVSTTPRRFTPGKDPVPIVQEAGWAPGLVWTCAKNLALTGIRPPDRPVRSQSLYRLSDPGPHKLCTKCNL